MINQMKNVVITIFIPLLFVAISCSPDLTVTWTDKKYEPRSYSKMAVVGTGKDLKARIEFEESAVELLRKEGINVIAGIDVFPDKMMEDEKRIENTIKIIRENNLDGVLTMSLVDTQETARFSWIRVICWALRNAERRHLDGAV